MVNIIYIFWMYVILFAVIGVMRVWAKELLVSFSVILALAMNHLLRTYIELISSLPNEAISLFWTRTLITVALVYFGYQTVGNIGALSGKARKEKLQDALFGGVMGGMNGYLIIGTLWTYLDDAGYPFDKIFVQDFPPEILNEVGRMMKTMPPQFFGDPGIYFAVIIAFIFIIVVYI